MECPKCGLTINGSASRCPRCLAIIPGNNQNNTPGGTVSHNTPSNSNTGQGTNWQPGMQNQNTHNNQQGTNITVNARLIGKIGFLLVVFGFFQPIACQMNGFELAKLISASQNTMNIISSMDFVGSSGSANTIRFTITSMCLYLVFFSALAGCIIGVLLILNKEVKVSYDWICLLVSIGCGLYVFFTSLNNKMMQLQSGAYFIIFGWLVALIAQIKHNTG